MNTVLALETSSVRLSVALGTREGRVRELCSRAPLQHSENLIPLIDRLLKKEKLRLDRIDAFAIDRGPGSFTGLRIGASLLKGFLAVRKRPCYGALSLDMMASKIDLPQGTRLGVVVDARREAVYSRFYQSREGKWVREEDLELLSFAELIRRIREGTYLVGDALIRYQPKLEEEFGNQIHFLAKEASFPSGATLVRWFQAKDPRLTLLKSPHDFLPLYFRPPEAEEKKSKVISHAT